MRWRELTIVVCSILLTIMICSFDKYSSAEDLVGAWVSQSELETEVLQFADGYCVYTVYNVPAKKFHYTYGGRYTTASNEIMVHTSFDTRQSDHVGKPQTITFAFQDGLLHTTIAGSKKVWKKTNTDNRPLSGVWRITQRMQEGKLQAIHQTGSRQTIKMLAGDRFQWIAIDSAQKGFYGTGGGEYTFGGGKYTEQILFFSRDSSRVGASLQFSGELKDGHWHHSGKSSKGDDIYEVWSRTP